MLRTAPAGACATVRAALAAGCSSMYPGKRISSRNTFFMKRVFPFIAFGGLALIVAVMLFAAQHSPAFPFPALLGPVVAAVIFYVVLKRLVFDLADEVSDVGDALVVRFGADEERIPLAEIINVSYAGLTNPRRVTLTLRHPGRFGREVTFSPLQGFADSLSLRSPPLVEGLIERVDAARRR
jgi:hypothetical protein